MIWGAEVTRGAVREVATCGAGTNCGAAEAGDHLVDLPGDEMPDFS